MNVLSGLYGRATEIRRARYTRRPHRPRRLDRPVISVGTLVIGGSGKTPIVVTLARLLTAAGERPAILSRGYGRRQPSDGVVTVSDGKQVLATAAQSGDEPYMLARKLPGVPVLVSADRYLSGRLAERRFACTVHLLDDGFQHLQLARDVDLVAISRADLEERVLPLGRLREPLSAARAADALLVSGSDEDLQVAHDRAGVQTAFRVIPRYHEPRRIASAFAKATADRPVSAEASASVEASADRTAGPSASAQMAAGTPLGLPLSRSIGRTAVAVAAIARPERFFTALRELGCDVAREVRFRDHHWFTARDVERIQQAAAEARADIVITTEKDAVRLEAVVTGHQELVWAFLPMEVAIEPADRFASWLAGRLAHARGRRAPQARTAPTTLAGPVAERRDIGGAA